MTEIERMTKRTMTDEQRFEFDLKGYLIIPGVLSEEETAPIREHITALCADPESIAPEKRSSAGGPAQILLDHPVVVGILDQIIGGEHGQAYGYRCDNSFPMYRKAGETGQAPHTGLEGVGPLVFQAKGGAIYSGLTRVVWELNEVKPGYGGTLLMPGSHKRNFPIPKEHSAYDSPLFEKYNVPPGSVLFFSEGVQHAGPTWTHEGHPRVAVFNSYCRFNTQHHKLNVPPEVIETMPSKRQQLFRGTWWYDFDGARTNDSYDRTDSHVY